MENNVESGERNLLNDSENLEDVIVPVDHDFR